MRADLHIHTTASDGRWRPEQVVAEVRARGIGLFAIADHDTVASVPRAESLAREAELAFLRGVEVSSLLDGHLFHVLAYDPDPHDVALAALLRENRAKLDQFNEGIVHFLIAEGHPLDLSDYVAYEADPARGGWKVLNFLIDRGFCADVGEYFRNVVARLPANNPPFSHAAQVIATIREAGGVPILAHPSASLRPVGLTDETLAPFLDFGIAGLECFSPVHDDAATRFCRDWCARHDLLVTGGSDYHGGFAGRKLGVPRVDSADLRLGSLAQRIVS